MLFIQDVSGKRHMRARLRFNKQSGTVEWHWTQKGIYDVFRIEQYERRRGRTRPGSELNVQS